MRHTCIATRGTAPTKHHHPPQRWEGGTPPDRALAGGRHRRQAVPHSGRRAAGGSPEEALTRRGGTTALPGAAAPPHPVPSAGEAQARWRPPRRRRLRGQAEARRGAPAAGFRHRRKAALLPLPPLGARPAPTQRRGRMRQRWRLLPARSPLPTPHGGSAPRELGHGEPRRPARCSPPGAPAGGAGP